MISRLSITVLGALVSLLLTACETTSVPGGDAGATSWYLQPDAQSTKAVFLAVGMSMNEVKDALGRPSRVRKPKGADEANGIWTYQREIRGVQNMTSMGSPNGEITVRQDSRFVETVTIRFAEGRVESVDVYRRPEVKNAVSAPFGPGSR